MLSFHQIQYKFDPKVFVQKSLIWVNFESAISFYDYVLLIFHKFYLLSYHDLSNLLTIIIHQILIMLIQMIFLILQLTTGMIFTTLYVRRGFLQLLLSRILICPKHFEDVCKSYPGFWMQVSCSNEYINLSGIT